MRNDRSSPTGKYTPLCIKEKISAASPSSDDIDLAPGVSEGDIRMVEAYYYELALDASKDRSPPTPEEEIELGKLAASFERLKAMTREEMLAERVRRLRQRRRFE